MTAANRPDPPAVRRAGEDLARRFGEAWSSGEPAAFEPLCTPDVHYEDPLTPDPLTGLEALGRHAQRLREGVPDVNVELTGACLGDGLYLAIPCRITGTHSRWLADLPPSGQSFRIHAVAYCELEDARLRRVRAFFDAYDAAVQVGVLPRRGTVGERALMLVRGFGLKMPPLRPPRIP